MKQLLVRLVSIWPVWFILLATLVFFTPVFQDKMPFPGDTLIGAYQPWRGLSWQGRTTEYPLKNMTISDVTSSLYPWRYLAVKQMKEGKWPLWNNYEFSGTPLLAVPYTAAFYPLNFFFFLLPFTGAWTILVVLQPLLAGIFFYFFLLNKRLSKTSSCLGAICFAFGSYFLNTTEFSILGHTALWFPLALLSVDKLFEKPRVSWFFILVFALAMAVLAGFVQFIIYGYVLVIAYTLFHFFFGQKIIKKAIVWVALGMVISGFLTLIQTLPFLELLGTSGRIMAYGDVSLMTNFFIPLPQLLMFLIPDFFGNPATANYWGKINYFEFNGYVGIVALIFVLYLLLAKRIKKEGWFWLLLVVFSLFLAIENPISALPYNLQIPFLSAFIPARLVFFVAFALSILTAMGYEDLVKQLTVNKTKAALKPLLMALGLLVFSILIAATTIFLLKIFGRDLRMESIILRNSILPAGYLLLAGAVLIASLFFSTRKVPIFLFLILLIVLFDLSRQGRKFLPFFDKNLVYPEITTTKFLQQNLGFSRFLPLHQEIFGTNHQTVYGLESIEGFSAYYNDEYGTFVSLGQEYAPIGSFKPRFERTVYGRNYQANIFNLLSVKYFLSFQSLDSADYPLVFEEGRVKVYENKKVLPRIFLTCGWEKESNPQEIIKKISLLPNAGEKVFVQRGLNVSCKSHEAFGQAQIIHYSAGEMVIDVEVPSSRILVLSDIFFPGWKVLIDDKKEQMLKVNYVLRGVVVPAGRHKVKFIYDPQSFRIGAVVSVMSLILLVGFSSWVLIKKRSWW